MIDFNGYGPQGGAGAGVIPPESMVWVKLHIQMPKQGSTGSAVELTRARNSTMEFLSTELEVQQGQFKGAKIYHRFNVAGASTPGQKKAVDISMKQLGAILEVARNITPEDVSPQATEARRVNGWGDFEGVAFPCKVGCEPSNSAKKNDPTHFFVNNTLVKVVTRADGEFSSLSQPPYELISALPVPEFPVNGAAPAPTAQQAWGAPQAQAAPAPQPQAQAQAWGAPAPQTQTPPPLPTAAPQPGTPAPAWAQPAPAPQGDSVPFS
jgi:hypothetical protein